MYVLPCCAARRRHGVACRAWCGLCLVWVRDRMSELVGDGDLEAPVEATDAAAALLERAGVCVITEALPREIICACRESLKPRFQLLDEQLLEKGVDLARPFRFNEVCRRRLQRYDIRGRLIDGSPLRSSLLGDAAPWLPLMRHVLGDDAVELWRGVIDNRPGSETQSWHRDGEHLFEHVHLPAHCITIFVPLVDLEDDLLGPTQFYPGSHICGRSALYHGLNSIGDESDCYLPFCTPRLAIGDVIAFDYRTIHRGLANTSHLSESTAPTARPMLYIVYARSWFIDRVNFPSDAPLWAGDQLNEHLQSYSSKR